MADLRRLVEPARLPAEMVQQTCNDAALDRMVGSLLSEHTELLRHALDRAMEFTRSYPPVVVIYCLHFMLDATTRSFEMAGGSPDDARRISDAVKDAMRATIEWPARPT